MGKPWVIRARWGDYVEPGDLDRAVGGDERDGDPRRESDGREEEKQVTFPLSQALTLGTPVPSTTLPSGSVISRLSRNRAGGDFPSRSEAGESPFDGVACMEANMEGGGFARNRRLRRAVEPGDGVAARIKSLIRAVPDFPIPGVRFRDVMGLTEDAEGFRVATVELASRFREAVPDVVVGIEARGFIFGTPVAQELGLGFVPVRKAGKLPGRVRGVDYDLEYGSGRLEMQVGSIGAGSRVLVIDDLLATGGSAAAAIELIREMGGKVVGAGFVVDLPELGGAERLHALGVEVVALCAFRLDEK